ncbi:MAG TPA: ECF-type sigma factor [Thermoanaerobaculia bacterium]|nr:ECF-type sigma factor [Thermoanaerobaculia bacterium]
MPSEEEPLFADKEGVTELLVAFSGGDRRALDRLVPLVYAELRRIASRRLRGEGPAETLQTTSLVNEAYLRLVDGSRVPFQSRAHFFAVAAQAMRYILVDRARERAAQKRSGGAEHLSLDEVGTGVGPAAAWAEGDHADRVIAVHEALERLGEVDPQMVSVVELRFFVGLTLEEVAQTLAISSAAAWREWAAAKAFLTAELGGLP